MSAKKVVPEGKLAMKFTNEQAELKKETVEKLAKLLKEKKFDEIINEAQSALNKLPTEPLGDGDKDISNIYFLLASAHWEKNEPPEIYKEYALKSAHFNRMNKGALWLIREANNEFSDNAVLLRLQVAGNYYYMDANEKVKQPFRTVYTAIADDSEDAMKYVKEFERDEIKDSLELIKATNRGKKPKEPKGVYEAAKLVGWYEK